MNIAALASLLLTLASSAGGAVFQVDTTAGASDASPGDGICADTTGICGLTTAVEEANALLGPDTVSVPPGTYVLGSAIWDDLTLRGAGADATVIDPRGFWRGCCVYHIAGNLLVERLRVTGGAYGGIVSIPLAWGNAGSLVLSDSIVSGNCSSTVADSTAYGDYCAGVESDGALTVRRTVITGNLSTAIAVNAGTALIENSTISGNVARSGRICVPGYACYCAPKPAGVDASGGSAVEIRYSTIVGNSHDSSLCVAGPRPVVEGFVRLVGTVHSNPGLSNCGIEPGGSLGHNLDSDGSCGLDRPTDLSNVDPLLGPLADHGGPTSTHALLPGSPALDAIPPADCTYDHDGDPATPAVALATDQRGAPRPQGAGCDIGAFEATACSDGLDNDGDGYRDHPSDPGCRYATSTLERTQCQDGINNDYAPGIDFDGGASVNGGVPISTADPQCVGMPWKNREAATGCGLGFEVTLALLLLALARRRRDRSRSSALSGV